MDGIKSFVQSKLPTASLASVLAGTQKFEVSVDSVKLSDLFTWVSESRDDLGIVDWAVCNSTLEDVFVKVCTVLISCVVFISLSFAQLGVSWTSVNVNSIHVWRVTMFLADDIYDLLQVPSAGCMGSASKLSS